MSKATYKGGDLIILCLQGGVFSAKKKNESTDHLFLYCDFAFRLWSNILKEFGKDWVIPRSSKDLLTLGHGLSLSTRRNTLWKVAVSATLWAIWLERNKRIFEETEKTVESTWNRIRLWVGI